MFAVSNTLNLYLNIFGEVVLKKKYFVRLIRYHFLFEENRDVTSNSADT